MEESKVKSLSKALDVLECFSIEQPELGITEICNKLGLYKSNVHNIVATFEKHGYLTKNPLNNKYKLGLNILKLSNIISSNLHERDFILPHIKKIANETDEIVYYAILHNKQVLYLDYACTSGTIIETSKMGVMAPVYCTATGKAIMSCLPKHDLDSLMQDEFNQYTERTITDKEQMRIELDKSRKRGYSVDNMEHEYGIKGVGVPILDRKGYPFAAISVSGPSLRFDEGKVEFFASLLKQHKEAIERQLP
ncbi:IclR family transcriptional regulator [Cohnella boryungensis]|uniref:IclR family transcriptional regulator n=1 Tax=Cohnella boryungensis TaxID=768479 RepID=A0ABV8S2X6_9BACL